MQIILKHIDWLGVFLSLSGWFLMGKRRFFAILVLILTNIVWLTWALTNNVYSMMVLSTCFIILNVKTIINWIKDEKKKPLDFQDKTFIRLKQLTNTLKNNGV